MICAMPKANWKGSGWWSTGPQVIPNLITITWRISIGRRRKLAA